MNELQKIDPNKLPELSGLKEKQLEIVKNNPFVAISDIETYENAKKSRTALVTARTDIQKQDSLIASTLKTLRQKVSKVSDELIQITLPHETKQQEEVKRYEAEKEAERIEKARIEHERKEAIRNDINVFYNKWKTYISNADFKNIKKLSVELKSSTDAYSEKDMEDFRLTFLENIDMLNSQLKDRETYLNEREAQRIEDERLAKERAKMDAERKAYEAKKAAEEEKLRKEAKERSDKMDAKLKEIAEREAAVEKEKELHRQKLAKEQRDKEIAEEKERQEKERIKNEKRIEAEKVEAKKRADAMKPDIEKLKNVIANIGIHMEAPEFKNKTASTFYLSLKLDIEDLKKRLLNELNNI